MRSCFVKILFAFCTWELSKGIGVHKPQEEDGVIGFNENETAVSAENALTMLLQEQPVAILLELREPLLEKVKARLEDENGMDFPIGRTMLATFDATGLQDVYVFNKTMEIRDAISNLGSNYNPEDDIPTPTTNVLGELLQGNLPEGSVLLITMSRPSDENFGEELIRSLSRMNIQLNVLWGGNYSSEDNLPLKIVSERTGGKFGYLMSENTTEENPTVEYFPKSEFENLSQQIKFPEEPSNIEEEGPLVSRAADQKVSPKAVVPLIVEVASGTSLEVRPGTPTQIQFNVKNNINVPLSVFFNARYNGIIQNVQPPQSHIPPSVTVTVIVNLQPIGAAQSANAIGTLTLSAVAANTVTARQALIFLTPQTVTDYYAPKLTYKYEGDCSNYKEPQNCEQGQWRLEATLQDEDSGLLKVLSEPYGLLFQSQFVAGSRTPVTVYYTATCCQPNVVIWAEDLKGNYVKKSFDVFNQNLLAGEIASIVIGVLFLIFIIIAIIVAVVLIKRRNRRNLIIPRPRSGSR